VSETSEDEQAPPPPTDPSRGTRPTPLTGDERARRVKSIWQKIAAAIADAQKPR